MPPLMTCHIWKKQSCVLLCSLRYRYTHVYEAFMLLLYRYIHRYVICMPLLHRYTHIYITYMLLCYRYIRHVYIIYMPLLL